MYTREHLNSPIFWKYQSIQWVMYWVIAIGMLLFGFILKKNEMIIFGGIFTAFMIGLQIFLWRVKVNSKKEKEREALEEEEEHWAEIMNQVDDQQQSLKDEGEWWDEVYKNIDTSRV